MGLKNPRVGARWRLFEGGLIEAKTWKLLIVSLEKQF